jgi:hypothetical protein
MRNNAYKPGTFGVAKGTPAVDEFVERLRSNFMPSLALSLDRFISLWGASASTATAEATLSCWKFLPGPFVGYQIALNTAYVSRGWFDATSPQICDVRTGQEQAYASMTSKQGAAINTYR